MRPILFALIASGCTLTNRVEETQIPPDTLPVEICNDEIDNDQDGEIDCEDANCRDDVACQEDTEARCGDGVDNDLDGLVDCNEPDCLVFAYCKEADEAACSDREDNDHDGLVDCREIECQQFAHCQEATDVACQDRLDNDEDGFTDCNDDACHPFFACFSTTPLIPETCEVVLRPETSLVDDFEAPQISTNRWQVFHSAGPDQPTIHEGQLDTNGRDNFGTAGVASVETFQVGVDQPFELSVGLRHQGPCPPGECALTVELHTRREWGDAFTDGASVAAIRLDGSDTSDQLRVACSYHGRPITPATATVPVGDGVLTLRMALKAGASRMVYSVGDDTLCESPEADGSEPEAHLVLHGGGTPLAAGASPTASRLLIDDVSIRVAAQSLPDRCIGIGRPLLTDGFCDGSRIDSAGMRRPRAVVRQSADALDWHLFPDMLRSSHTVVGHARSADGRSAWVRSPANSAALTPDDFDDWHMGAFRWSQDAGRFEAWGRGGGLAPHRFLSGPNDAANWSADEPLTINTADLDIDIPSWAPEAVVHDGQRYIGWFSLPDADGAPSIHRATSEDWLGWTADPAPAISRGGEQDWNSEGAWSPSVTQAEGFWVMAYVSQQFGESPKVGVAASRDGEVWVQHRDNPIWVGSTPSFDIDGVESPSIVAVPGGFRLWYTAVHSQLLDCGGSGGSTGEQRRIGFTTLQRPR